MFSCGGNNEWEIWICLRTAIERISTCLRISGMRVSPCLQTAATVNYGLYKPSFACHFEIFCRNSLAQKVDFCFVLDRIRVCSGWRGGRPHGLSFFFRIAVCALDWESYFLIRFIYDKCHWRRAGFCAILEQRKSNRAKFRRRRNRKTFRQGASCSMPNLRLKHKETAEGVCMLFARS